MDASVITQSLSFFIGAMVGMAFVLAVQIRY